MVRIDVQPRPEEAARVLLACDLSAEARPDGMVAMAEAVPRGQAPDRPPVEALVHVDAESHTGHTGDAGVSAETSRRLLCDAAIIRVVEDARGTPLDVGRKTRSISTALRRALLAHDGGCRYPGSCGGPSTAIMSSTGPATVRVPASSPPTGTSFLRPGCHLRYLSSASMVARAQHPGRCLPTANDRPRLQAESLLGSARTGTTASTALEELVLA